MNASAAKKNNNRDNTERTEVNIEEFVPYACHYNPHTILTKNGELLQVIKVTGFSYESVHKDEHTRLSLRQAIRMAVLEGIGTDKFAVYFHTIRRKSDLSTGGKYPTLFSKRLNKAWCERHDWERQYTNELYVTVMTEGDFFRAKDLKFFLRSVRFKKELNKRMQFIEDAAGRLENAVIAMMKTLEEYGAHRLEIVKDHEGVCYSELSGFLSKIINLGYEEIPLTTTDLSSVLPSHHVSFGFNALEVRGHTGRHFGAMLTVKEYHEIRSKFIDEFLQIPQEFIVTESFDFVNKRQAMGAFKKQKFYLEVTESEHMAQITGLDEILASDRGEKTDFGQHQIGIMILGDTLSSLDNGVRLALEGLHRIGVLAFREDIFMEDCYWAQLPGNFVFNKRKTYIPLMHIGGYASL